MWLRLIFLLITLGSTIADHYGWEIGNEYHFSVQSRTLTALNNLANQFSGILIKADFTVQVKSSDTLQAVISKQQYAHVNKVLPEGWESEITDLEFQELSLSGKPFEIKLKHGIIENILIDKNVPIWEVNLLKSIVSQLQIDAQGKNVITGDTRVPNDEQPFDKFKVMEESVGGKCEVLYNIEPPSATALKNPDLVKYPHNNDDIMIITKIKNYTNCEQQIIYHSGIIGNMKWKPESTDKIISRLSKSHILISGQLKKFVIHSSVTTNEISVNSKIHDTYSNSVYSKVNVILYKINVISDMMPVSNNLVSAGNLVYTYNNPISVIQSQQKCLSVNQSHSDNNNSSSSSFCNKCQEYLQSEPKLNEPPENLLLPYFIGYEGKSIQKSDKNIVFVAARHIDWITRKIINPQSSANTLAEIFERNAILIRLIRTMNVQQITAIENKLSDLVRYERMEFFDNVYQKLYDQTRWDVLCNAVGYVGTGPALLVIKNWIKNGKLEGIQAANIIARIPKAAITPTSEFIETFFQLIDDEQVRQQRFLNTTAPLSFAELIGYSMNVKSSAYYPKCFNDSFLQNYVSYMANKLREAIKDGDSIRIQTYIKALSNFGSWQVFGIFEPYLEGTLPVSKFQRLMMLMSLEKLSETFPHATRQIAYSIYSNIMETYELRCAAVYIIMKTNPPLGILEQMARFTNEDQNQQVNSFVKSTIEAFADLKQPEMQDLAENARIAKQLLHPYVYDDYLSKTISDEIISFPLNMAQTFIFQMIGSEDTIIPKNAFMDIYQSYGGFNLPILKISYAISNIRELLNMWPRIEELEKRSIIKEIIENLGIKSENPEQIEGNIFLNSLFVSMFYPFDNNTIEEMINMFTTYAASFKTQRVFEPKHSNYLYFYDTTLAFPTESGLPFVYTLTLSKLDKIISEGSHTVISSSTERYMNITVAGDMLFNEKFENRIGFITPFEHKHYIAGVDLNIQITVPAGLSFKHSGDNKFEIKLHPRRYPYSAKYLTIHNSVIPYTAKYDIMSFESIFNNDTRLVNTKKPHNIEFLLGENVLFKAKSDFIDINATKKTEIESLNDIYEIFCNSGAHYRKLDIIINVLETEVNLTFGTFMRFGNDSQATIPTVIDKRPESEERRLQFLQEVSKDTYSSVGSIYDVSVLNKNHRYVFTLAVADSHLENKLQVLFYSNKQLPDNGNVVWEFCTIGYTKSSRTIPLNYEKAVTNIPKTEFKAEMRFGNCANGETIKLEGNWIRTDDAKEVAMRSEVAKKCRQKMNQGNIWLPDCQKASDLINQKNYLIMSINTNSDYFYTLANGIIISAKTLIFKENINVYPPNLENIKKNTIDIKIKISPNYDDVNISLSSSAMSIIFSLSDIFNDMEQADNPLKNYIEQNSENSVCILDKTQVITFDNKIYPLNMGNCWHVVMTTYPKRDFRNPNKILDIPKYLRTLVMARETDNGSKQVQIFLDNDEIHLQKLQNRLKVMVNNQIINFTRYESYVENTFEIYELDGMVAIYSLEYESYFVYDGERILSQLSYKYLKSIRGLCGNYDMQSDNDFMTSNNCILTKPEEFVATYALTQNNCQGPALQNKQKAEQSTCSPISFSPVNVFD